MCLRVKDICFSFRPLFFFGVALLLFPAPCGGRLSISFSPTAGVFYALAPPIFPLFLPSANFFLLDFRNFFAKSTGSFGDVTSQSLRKIALSPLCTALFFLGIFYPDKLSKKQNLQNILTFRPVSPSRKPSLPRRLQGKFLHRDHGPDPHFPSSVKQSTIIFMQFKSSNRKSICCNPPFHMLYFFC